ncbi:MAG: hypothetical protein H7A33_01875 [Deltaproteobacteria bacterium]|nr:hypothetical protein [Deltaproteobacteria bacterium]
MKRFSFFLEIPAFFVFLVFLNEIFFPEIPAFIDVSPHPYWGAILLFGFRYGIYAGLASGISATVIYLGTTWLQGDRYLFDDLSFFILPSLFIVIGALIGSGVNRFLRQIREYQIVHNLDRDEIKQVRQELKDMQLVTEGLEKRITTKMTTLVTLHEGARSLDSLKKEEILQSALRFIAKALDFEKVALYLKKDNRWELVYKFGWQEGDYFPSVYESQEGLVGISGSQNKVISLKDTLAKGELPMPSTQDKLNLQNESLLAGPIANGEGNEPLGVISVQSMPLLTFNSGTTNLFRFILNWISRSLQRANYFDEIRAQEILDPEFGIFSHRYLERRLGQEFHRSQVYYLPLSLVLIKISSLLDENPASQKKTLVTVIQILKNICQETDVIARDETDPSLIHCLLTTTSETQAKKFIETLKQTQEELGLKTIKEFSIGFSTFNPKLKSEKELVHAALESIGKI